MAKQVIFTQITKKERIPKLGEMILCDDGGFVAADTTDWKASHVFRREESEIPDPEPIRWGLEPTGEVRPPKFGEWCVDKEGDPRQWPDPQATENGVILKLVPVYEE